MLYVDNQNITRPQVNLALEEYLLRQIDTDEDILLFYVNEPSIIIGRHQNTIEEINQGYVEAHGIHVVRRLSGGGAVYHDLGNLNFSFITDNLPENIHNFHKFTDPVIQVLKQLGVPAELSGRNDILADGRKISGNAQYITTHRMVSHGTLLFNTDLSTVAEALNVKAAKIESKGIKSVRSRVANISEFITAPLDLAQFRQRILQGIFDGNSDPTTNARTSFIPELRLDPAQWQAVHALADSRYQSWEWNYGYSPAFNVQKTRRFPSGLLDARIDVHNGKIQTIKFFGDFFARADLNELETGLAGRPYRREELADALSTLEVGHYFSGITAQELLEFLIES